MSFEEAETVFSDEHALLINDPDHSDEEERFILLGLSAALRTLLVCQCYRERDEVIRIISARKATRPERPQYNRWVGPMRKQYDFSGSTKNPYAQRLKKPITIRLDEATIAYFKELAAETEIPYQTLINLYLRECAASRKRLSLRWKSPSKQGAV